MAFQAVEQYTGVPDFRITRIDPEEVAKAFQTYLNTASNLTGVSLDDINRGVIERPADSQTVTLVELLEKGMKLFDAVIWLSAGRPVSHPLQVDPGMRKENILSLHEVARSLFFCYFMLLTQARYPVATAGGDQPKVPNFLKTIMGMEKDQSVYVQNVSSFPPQKFDPQWVRYVSFRGLGQETLSRFGLGVAGYRLFGPFGLYAPKPNVDPTLMPAYNFARKIAKAPATWDVHPITRHANVLTKRGNLNKNLGNLILEVFSDEDIEQMKESKILFKKPEYEAGHRNYKQWTEEDDISGTNFIFSD